MRAYDDLYLAWETVFFFSDEKVHFCYNARRLRFPPQARRTSCLSALFYQRLTKLQYAALHISATRLFL